MSSLTYHQPIMLNECIEGLNIQPEGIYVDCTFGGGGHSKKILERLNDKGKLIAFDQDADAQQNLIDDKRFEFFDCNFMYMKHFLRWQGIEKVDGILADLGISSFQIDNQSRGFSIKNDEVRLDMRMDKRVENDALYVLNGYQQEQLANVFFEYGEILNSRQLAQCIVENRKLKRIENLDDLRKIIFKVIKGNEQKYLTRLFQAIRIEVNQELEVLKKMLGQTSSVLKQNGRLVVMSFHSLEDRLIKRLMRNEDLKTGEKNEQLIFEMLTKKPIEASFEETKKNSRSKSAKLRIAKKL